MGLRQDKSGGCQYTSGIFVNKKSDEIWGSLHWTQYDPPTGGAGQETNSHVFLDIDVSDDKANWYGAFTDQDAIDASNSLEASNLGHNLGNTLYYRVNFKNRNTVPLVDTAVFDDICVTVITEPQFISYREIIN